MTFLNMTGQELIDLGQQFCGKLLNFRGYDSTELTNVSLRSDGALTINFEARDLFQDELDSSDRYMSSYWLNIQTSSIEELETVFQNWPTRERREFTVLRKRLAGVGAFADQLVTASGQAFAADLAAMCKQYNLLEER